MRLESEKINAPNLSRKKSIFRDFRPLTFLGKERGVLKKRQTKCNLNRTFLEKK